jgi:hypothetical protein
VAVLVVKERVENHEEITALKRNVDLTSKQRDAAIREKVALE